MQPSVLSYASAPDKPSHGVHVAVHKTRDGIQEEKHIV